MTHRLGAVIGFCFLPLTVSDLTMTLLGSIKFLSVMKQDRPSPACQGLSATLELRVIEEMLPPASELA